MKSKLFVLMLLAGGSLFAAPHISIGVGIGVPGYVGPSAVVVAGRPPYPGPGYRWIEGYYAPNGAWIAGYWAAPNYAPGYYAPNYYYGGSYWRGRDWDHDGYRDHEWREHGRHEWREHERHEHHEHEEHEHGRR